METEKEGGGGVEDAEEKVDEENDDDGSEAQSSDWSESPPITDDEDYPEEEDGEEDEEEEEKSKNIRAVSLSFFQMKHDILYFQNPCPNFNGVSPLARMFSVDPRNPDHSLRQRTSPSVS